MSLGLEQVTRQSRKSGRFNLDKLEATSRSGARVNFGGYFAKSESLLAKLNSQLAKLMPELCVTLTKESGKLTSQLVKS